MYSVETPLNRYLEDEFEILFSFKDVCACFQNYSYKDHVELWALSKEMFTLDFHPRTNGKQWKNMEGPSTRCMVEDIKYRGGFTAEELVI